MSILAGSHREGTLGYHKRPKKLGYTDHAPVGMDSIVKRYDEIWCDCSLGDVVVFAGDLIHRSNRNASGRTLFSGIYRNFRLDHLPIRTSFNNDMS